MKKPVNILVFCLLLVSVIASSVVAFNFDVSIAPSERSIRMNESAEYALTIRHSENFPVVFDVYSLDIFWDFHTKEQLVVPPSGLTTTLYVRPLRPRDPGYYGVPLTVRTEQFSQSKQVNLLLGLRPVVDVPRQYVPSIRTTVHAPVEVDPRKEFTVSVDVENLNSRNITDMSAYLRSSLIKQDKTLTLQGNEKKTITFTVQLDGLTKPQDDTLYISFVTEHENRTIRFETTPAPLKIVSYGDLDEVVELNRSFLKLFETHKLTNSGNDLKSTTYRIREGFFESWFTRTDPVLPRVDGFYSLELTLNPKETRTIVVYRNYWSLFIAIIVLVLIVAGYFVFRSPIVIYKQIRHVKGPRELKVSIHVKNRSRKTTSAVDILDKVPKMFEVIREGMIGSIEPVSVLVNEHVGSRIKWVIPQIRAGEEIIVTYQIRSRLELMGQLSLEPAIAEVRARHRKFVARSNTMKVNMPTR